MNDPYTPHGTDLDHDIDEDFEDDYRDEDPATYGDRRYNDDFQDFVCPDGSLHAKAF
jgi:hypothetical protein